MPDTYYGSGDIQALLDEFGIPVTVGAVTAKAVRDTQDEAVAAAEDGSIVGRMVSLVVKTGTYPTLAEGVAATVEGTAYTVKQQLLIDDGALTLVRCAKV